MFLLLRRVAALEGGAMLKILFIAVSAFAAKPVHLSHQREEKLQAIVSQAIAAIRSSEDFQIRRNSSLQKLKDKNKRAEAQIEKK